MKTALVTGGAGFLGFHLCEKLLTENFQVIAVDNFITGQLCNITELKKKYGDKFFFIEADITRPWQGWQKNLPSHFTENIQYIFHFASVAAPHLFRQHSLEILSANSVGLMNAVSFADGHQARLIFASTSEIYGSATSAAFQENNWGLVNSFGERSCYDESKRFGEAFIFSTNLKNSTNHGVVRIFNTYGPRMNPQDERVIQNVIKRALAGLPILIYGSGTQTRSFCFVSDLIDGIFSYAEKNLMVPVNLGNDEEISILNLIGLVEKLLNTELKIVHTSPRPDDPMTRKPEIGLGLKLLYPWKPNISLTDGLQKLINYLSNPEF